ncbi:MAG: insulinase family protein [Candidatus Melainabacteria bacterium]|nr:insulinase family protein [Candidatus Melainabacteria bacterium]
MLTSANYKPPKIITLENGLRIISEEIPGALSCTLSIWINVGSIDEEVSNNGVSHFIEHIIFKGTKTRTALEIAEQSENVGANLNAFTDREHTCYHTRILSEHVLVALELFLDMLFNSRMQDNDFDLEKQVILEEIKMYEDTPEDLVQDLLYEVVWKGHPLGKPITGTIESITNLKKKSVFNFLSDLYTPDNMIISLAGKYDLAAIIQKTEKLTSNINNKNKKKDAPPLIITPDIFIKDKDIEQTHLSFATKGVSVYDEERYTLAVIDIAMGGGMSSRLFQEVREKRGLAYVISSYYHTNKLGGLFGVYAGTTAKESSHVIELILKELNAVKKDGLKPDELERAKMQLKTSLFLELESTMVRASRNALYDLYYKRFLTPDEINSSVQLITNERIIKLANVIFNSKYYTLTAVGPRNEMPKKFSLG